MRPFAFLTLAALAVVAPLAAADAIGDVARRAAETYEVRLQKATEELNATRQRILQQQQPLAETTRKLEEQITALESEILDLQTLDAQKVERKQQLTRDSGNLHKTVSYLTSLAQDTLKTAGDSLLPGEGPRHAESLQLLQQKVEQQGRAADLAGSIETVEFMVGRTRRQLGGYAATGTALIGEDNRLVPGTFAFVGPEAFFRADSGVAGTVRTREGGVAATYPLADWKPADSAAFVSGVPGTMHADPSGGKALRLREITGSVWQHIERGGLVSYVILAVGALTIVLIIQKLIDLRRYAIDTGPVVERALDAARRGAKPELEAIVGAMKRTTRDLFTAGLRNLDKPKSILEEHLFARTLESRLHLERRLPLLAVIATAAPLLGLLGTVMGMVKTFALITVFGTGNAGKLSAGISEVLVATELGLMVAIPALVVHGFLSHRIQKNLSLLDRYAIEFLTAAEEAKAGTTSDAYAAR